MSLKSLACGLLSLWLGGCGLLQREWGLLPDPEDCSPISLEQVALGAKALGPAHFMAHGGGAVGEFEVSNSLEALDTNYAGGLRMFELDFSRTADGHLVAIHDWGRWQEIADPFDPNQPVPTKQQFLDTPRKDGLTSLAIEDALRWLEQHPDTQLVLDTKTDNTYAFNYLQTREVDFTRVLAEVFGFREYLLALKIKLLKPILSYYRLKASDEEILDFIDEWKVQYMAFPIEKVGESDLVGKVRGRGVCIYAHETSNEERMNQALAEGVHGFYVDRWTISNAAPP